MGRKHGRASADREGRAVALRDQLVPLVQQQGQRHQYGCAGRAGPLHLTTWESGPYRFILREPFMPLGHVPAPASHRAPEPRDRTLDDPVSLAYGLDGWLNDRVMLSLAWNVAGPVMVLTFQPGTWADEALAR
jgi:hypothetical protein